MTYRCDKSALGWALVSESPTGDEVTTVDYLRSHAAAQHALRELHAGRARIEHHRPLGCRVQPVSATRTS